MQTLCDRFDMGEFDTKDKSSEQMTPKDKKEILNQVPVYSVMAKTLETSHK